MDTALTSPIHIEVVGLANIRFFAPPSGGREFPWVAFDDVTAAMTLPRSLRRTVKAELRNSQWRHDVVTLLTPQGPVEIIPHYQAQGLIDAMVQVGRCSKEMYWAYAKAGAKANIITDGYGKTELLEYLRAAMAAGGGLA